MKKSDIATLIDLNNKLNQMPILPIDRLRYQLVLNSLISKLGKGEHIGCEEVRDKIRKLEDYEVDLVVEEFKDDPFSPQTLSNIRGRLEGRGLGNLVCAAIAKYADLQRGRKVHL